MRPTVYMLSAAALAVAALASDTAAQDRTFSTIVTGPEGVRVFRTPGDENRPVLGVSLALARGVRDTLGVRISEVTEDGPAAKAGIEEGDRIVAIDGTTLRIDAADAADPAFADLASRRLQRALSKHKPGDEVTLTVLRGRDSRTVKVKTVAAADLPMGGGRTFAIGRLGEEVRGYATAREFADSVKARAERRPAIGLSLGTTGNQRDTLGLFVSAVANDGPAEKAGIIEGARIASIDGVDLRVARDDADDPEVANARSRRFTRELQKHEVGDDVTLRVWQNGAYRNVTIKAAKSTDVYKGQNGFSFSFGEGDAPFVMPAMPAMPSMGTTIRTPRASTFQTLPVVPRTPTTRRVYDME